MSVSLGVQLERDNALTDAKDVIDERGMDIVTYERQSVLDANDVRRDAYGSIKRNITTTASFKHELKAYPVISQPNNKQIEKAGLREQSEMIIYTAMKDWNDLNIGFEDIDLIRDTMTIGGIKFAIKEKNTINHFADIFLNVVFSLVKV